MTKKEDMVITGDMIEIMGALPRHLITKKVVNTFIETEYLKKGKGVVFRYPIENMPDGQRLYIARPGHKKNFDFKVIISPEFKLSKGSHKEIAEDIRRKKQENQQKFEVLLDAITEIYNCSENEVDKILEKYPDLNTSFTMGAKVEILLKVIKWLFIMEDIIYWDVEGRAFLFNFLIYAANESDDNRFKDALDRVKNPDILKSLIKKYNIEWIPYNRKSYE